MEPPPAYRKRARDVDGMQVGFGNGAILWLEEARCSMVHLSDWRVSSISKALSFPHLHQPPFPYRMTPDHSIPTQPRSQTTYPSIPFPTSHIPPLTPKIPNSQFPPFPSPPNPKLFVSNPHFPSSSHRPLQVPNNSSLIRKTQKLDRK